MKTSVSPSRGAFVHWLNPRSILVMALVLCIATPALATDRILEKFYKHPDRCADEIEVTLKDCETERNNSFAKGWLTQEEYNSAVRLSLIPAFSGSRLFAACVCGCFSAETQIFVESPGSSVAMHTQKAADIDPDIHRPMAVETGATLSNMRLTPGDISYTTSGPEKTDLYAIATSLGTTLRLTQNHGVLLADGRVVAAKNVEQSDLLVDTNGISIEIVSIKREKPVGDVFNFLMDGSDKARHLVVAEGVVVGDLAWQNSLVTELNQVALRE